jgi:hypothetical protein
MAVGIVTPLEPGAAFDSLFAGGQHPAITPDGSKMFFHGIPDGGTVMALHLGSDPAAWNGRATVTGLPDTAMPNTPGADGTGALHMILESSSTSIVEYVTASSGSWQAGGIDPAPSRLIDPSLSPDGRTLVFATADGIYFARRATASEPFSIAIAPEQKLASGSFVTPVLAGDCSALLAVTSGSLVLLTP